MNQQLVVNLLGDDGNPTIDKKAVDHRGLIHSAEARANGKQARTIMGTAERFTLYEFLRSSLWDGGTIKHHPPKHLNFQSQRRNRTAKNKAIDH